MAVRPLAAAAAALATSLALSLGACNDSAMLGGASTRSLTPIPPQTLSLMQTKGMSQSDPILIRAFKKESEMEVWKRTGTGQYALLKTFPICRWSGQLGPKNKQGDRQAPEGFYTITPGQMNPNSSYYLSFDVGYPNAVDRAKGGTGNYIMVHGTCSSAGCFAMTDASMAEIYAIAREAFNGGQRAFQFQAYPFRMTAANIAKFRNDPNAPFWKNLKEGSDYFEALKDEPRVAACGTKYVFGGSDVAAGNCTPRIDTLVAEKRDRDNREVAELIAKGTPATRVVYEDGGQNPVFRPQPAPTTTFASLTDSEKEKDKELAYTAKDYGRHHLGEVSRPESLALGPSEIEIDAKGKPILVAAAPADAPGPTKAAAARKASEKPVTVVAVQAPAKDETKPGAKAARITVADAEGDATAYHKVLGNLGAKKDKAAAEPDSAPRKPAAAATKPKPAHEAAPKAATASAKSQAAVTTTGSLKN
ncbi:L,D-transpeptidase family protein [Methylorubrum salsuginis]|uniref:Murein L,D-transpeptidase YafK n=1 Tax=Methylorubrum salsuginis TaxID=414703 RepID=A0A1I4IG54_9HYPH|nr:murein L,D-transpeptidase family protein [Methylorubrum salsuginis]SFL52801.1 Murein L,D-transpeptidase YafK [Methylorubrum salsuginis]